MYMNLTHKCKIYKVNIHIEYALKCARTVICDHLGVGNQKVRTLSNGDISPAIYRWPHNEYACLQHQGTKGAQNCKWNDGTRCTCYLNVLNMTTTSYTCNPEFILGINYPHLQTRKVFFEHRCWQNCYKNLETILKTPTNIRNDPTNTYQHLE